MTLLETLFVHYLGNDLWAPATCADCERELNLAPGTYNNREHYPILCAREALRDIAIFERETAQAKRPKPPKEADVVKIPETLKTAAFTIAWVEWLDYRRENHLSAWKPRTMRAKLAELEALGPEAAVEAIRRSIANGWKGIFPEKKSAAAGSRKCDRCKGNGYLEEPAAWESMEPIRSECKRCQGTGRF